MANWAFSHTFVAGAVLTASQLNTLQSNVLNNTVDLSGAQTIAGVKTFSASPIVPASGSGSEAVRASEICLLAGVQTLTGVKTLTTPVIADLTNMTHNHSTNANGGDTLLNTTLTTPIIGSFVNSTHNHSNNAGGGATLTSPTITSPTITQSAITDSNHFYLLAAPTQITLTIDANWHAYIVDASAKMALIRIYNKASSDENTTKTYVYLRPTGSAWSTASVYAVASRAYTPGSAARQNYDCRDFLVPCDSSGTFDYLIDRTTAGSYAVSTSLHVVGYYK